MRITIVSMKVVTAALLAMSLVSTTAWTGGDPAGPKQVSGAALAPGRDCRPYRSGEATVYRTDFGWGLSVPELREMGRRLYRGPKRLAHRLYRTPHGQVRAPVGVDGAGAEIVVPENFLRATIGHLRRAFQINAIDHLSLADTGHGHFYVPSGHFAGYERLKLHDQASLYERALNEPRLHVLYHAAERLKFKKEHHFTTEPDAFMRFVTRNLWGNPDGEIELIHNIDLTHFTNVVDRIDGFTGIGAGIHVHAQMNGCFQIRLDHRVINFDLALVPPAGEPNMAYDE